jgi:ADP-ribosylglycohydrolase
MLISKRSLGKALVLVLEQRITQGCDLDRLSWLERIESAAGSYDALYDIALELRDPPKRADWHYREPLDWIGILDDSPELKQGVAAPVQDQAVFNQHAETGFLASVCGCMLGKPIEVDPTLAELKSAALASGTTWPLDDYVSEVFLGALGRRHESAKTTVRENLRAAVADDDIHYTLIGMLLLEEFGTGFGAEQVFQKWALNLPHEWTWGAERSQLLALGLERHHIFDPPDFEQYHDPLMLNPGDESCGALIRVDAYGYACAGNPDLAAWLAFKDASLTHTRTGVYGAMFIAALIALSQGADPALEGNARLELVEQAYRRIPQKSRLAEVLADAVAQVAAASDWESGYQAVHGRYKEFSHCQVYQEIGTLINSLKFARNIDHGFCLQVSQGNDTDSFGATAGSILGCFFGPEFLDERWLSPLNDSLAHGLSDFHIYGLGEIAARIGQLPVSLPS